MGGGGGVGTITLRGGGWGGEGAGVHYKQSFSLVLSSMLYTVSYSAVYVCIDI